MFMRHRLCPPLAGTLPLCHPEQRCSFAQRMNIAVEGSAFENQKLLRLYHDQPIAESLHRITNSIYRRALQHKRGEIDGFTKRYNVNRLVYYEIFHPIGNAIAREKQIKSWTPAKRIALIRTENPTWPDLPEGWSEKIEMQIPRRAG